MIVELTYIRSSDTDSVGRTAARLGERLRNGVETAPGFVVTTDDLAELFDREKLAARLEGVPAEEAAAAAAEIIAGAELPADLVDDLAESYAALGRDAWVSVQASPTERDLGVSRDVLGPVQGADAVWALIRQVWASLWAPEAIARREDKGVTGAQEKLAVLVQQAEAPAEKAPAATGDTDKTAEKAAEETAPELPLDEPAEAPAVTEPVAPGAAAEAAEPESAEADEVVAEAELAEDEGRAIEQAEAIADEADPVEAAELVLAEAEAQEAVEDALAEAQDEGAAEALADAAQSGETTIEEAAMSGAPKTEATESTAGEPLGTETASDEAENAVADAESEPAASAEPEPTVEAEPVLDDESEPEPEVIETEAFETPAAGSDEAPGTTQSGGREEPTGPSQPRAQAPGGGSSFAASSEPSGRSRWIVIGLVSIVLLLIVRRLRRR